MPFTFKTTKGKTYYLKSRATKKGNTSYYLTQKKDAECLNELPAGYEAFEKYDSGQAYIRKVKESHIEEAEVAAIVKELRQNKSLHDFKLDVCGDEIRIYTNENGSAAEVPSLLKGFLSATRENPEAMWNRFVRYEERMRIILAQHIGEREFIFQRYCYRGSIDDWITIDSGSDLKALAKKNLYHLGKESYYELFGF
jgi:hypothetical protein